MIFLILQSVNKNVLLKKIKDISWSPRFPDINPIDFFSCKYIKNETYAPENVAKCYTEKNVILIKKNMYFSKDIFLLENLTLILM